MAEYKKAKSYRSIIINGEIKTVEYEKEDSNPNSNFQIPGEDTSIGLFAGLTITYNLYDAKKDYIEEGAITNIDISKIDDQKTRNEILLGVKNSYYSYLLAKNTLIIREKMLSKYRKKTDLAKQLFEQGSRPILDISKAEVDLADSQLQYEKSKNDERKTKLNLFHSMGLEEDEAITVKLKDIDKVPEIKYTLNGLYNMAEIYSPSLRILKLQKKVAKLKIYEQNASGFPYPSVDLILGLGYQNTQLFGVSRMSDNFNGQNWEPAIGFTFKAAIPIYSAGRISAMVDSATSDYYKISYREKELLIDIKTQIRDNFRSLEEIKKQMEISKLVTKNAQRHLLLAQKSYENGGGSLLELQDAELRVISAEIGFFEAKYGYLLTLAKISNLIGIGENNLCKNPE